MWNRRNFSFYIYCVSLFWYIYRLYGTQEGLNENSERWLPNIIEIVYLFTACKFDDYQQMNRDESCLPDPAVSSEQYRVKTEVGSVFLVLLGKSSVITFKHNVSRVIWNKTKLLLLLWAVQALRNILWQETLANHWSVRLLMNLIPKM